MFDTHLFDLSYVSTSRAQTPPEIVFSINQKNLPELQNRLSVLAQRFHEHFVEYLGKFCTEFELFKPDLFTTTFGYGACGYMTSNDGECHLRIRLCSHAGALYASATILLLTMALGWPFNEDGNRNQHQAIQLTTSAVDRMDGWGHAVHGSLSLPFMEWIRAYARGQSTSEHPDEMTPLPPEVLLAMSTTWEVLAKTNLYQGLGKTDINGWIRRSGAFSLICWGNACDLSVYPDQVRDELEGTTSFSCHNLDSSEQQLTLLSGLAKLCELARTSS